MKRLHGVLIVIVSLFFGAAALAQPPLPDKSKASLLKGFPAQVGSMLVSRPYFALAFLVEQDGNGEAKVMVNYFPLDKAEEEISSVTALGDKKTLFTGVDLTNHKKGVVQCVAYGYKDAALGRMLGAKLVKTVLWNKSHLLHKAAKSGPPATVVNPDGIQLMISNVNGKVHIFKDKMDGNVIAFAPPPSPASGCDYSVKGRPDITYKGQFVLAAWRKSDTQIFSARYELKSQTKMNKLPVSCCGPAIFKEDGKTPECSFVSDPVLASGKDVYYLAVAVKKKGENLIKLKIFSSRGCSDWRLFKSFDKPLMADCKLGLAAHSFGEILVAVVEKVPTGIKLSSWLYGKDAQGNMQWSDLGEKPWLHTRPEFKDFGLDAGGVFVK